MTTVNQRVFIESLPNFVQQEVALRGWVSRMRVLGKTTFVILKDCSGEVQCVAAPESIKEHHPVQGTWKLSANRAQTLIGAIERLCRDNEKLLPVGADLAGGDPEQFIEEGQSGPWMPTLKDCELLSQDEIF